MYKISGAKLLAFDFRDYTLLNKAFLSDNLLMKGTKFTDITDSGFDIIGIPEPQWRSYVKETEIRQLTVTQDGAGGTVKDMVSGEEIHIKRLGKIPTAFKKVVVSAVPKGKVKVYLSSSKVTSAVFSIGEPKEINFCVNKAISDSRFSIPKYEKLADAAIGKIKDNNSKIVFKLGEKAPTKFLALNHKQFGHLAAIYLRDPVKDKAFLLTFGPRKPPVGVSSHAHITVPDMSKDSVGFVAHLLKNMLFLAGKKIEKGLKGPEKLSALFPHLKKMVDGLVENDGFVALAAGMI